MGVDFRHMRPFAATLLAGLLALAGCRAAPEAPEPERRHDPATAESVLEADRRVIVEARRALADDRPEDAERDLSRWIGAEGNADSPYFAEALYLRGNAKLAQGEEFASLYDYERVARDFPASDVFTSVLERELDVAMLYLNGRSRRFAGLRVNIDGKGNGAIGVAEEIILRLNERLPGSVLAERALLALADYYYRTRDLIMAAETYDVFLDAFPRSTNRPLALQRRAFATIAQYKGPLHDTGGLIEARLQVEQFQREYPIDAERLGMSDALRVRLDESAAEQLLTTARWYLDRGDEPAARFMLTRLLYTHPTSGPARDALAIFGERQWPLPGAEKPALPAAVPEPTK